MRSADKPRAALVPITRYFAVHARDITYNNGTIVIKGLAHVPSAVLDPRTNTLRAQALQYSNILNYLHESNLEFSDYVLDLGIYGIFPHTNLGLLRIIGLLPSILFS